MFRVYLLLAIPALLSLAACHYFGNPYSRNLPPKQVPAAGDALRVEPFNWWVGMSRRRVEILVCRPGICEFNVQLGDARGITLEKADQSAGPDSLFLTLNIAPGAPPQRLPLHFSQPANNFRFTAEFPVFRRNSAPKASGLDQRHVIYRPPENTGYPEIDLGHLQDWGISAIWISPELPDTMSRPDLFRDWVRQCHYRDFRVVGDLIPESSGVDPCKPEINNRWYNAILQQALWRAEYGGLDGFRLDSCTGSAPMWLRQLCRDIRTEYPAIWLGHIDEDPFKNIIVPGGEDLIRFLSSAETDTNRLPIATAILLTSPGLPVINTAVNAPAAGLSTSAFARSLIRYRNATPALQNGRMEVFPPENGIYVYFRFDAAKTVMVMINPTGREQSVDMGQFQARLTGFSQAKEVISGTRFSSLTKISVRGNAVLMLELI